MLTNIFYFMLFFITGTAVGSFLNVLVDRSQDGENPLKGRSHCDTCKKPLSPLDLVPVLSFLFLRGRCRHCGAKLSYYYPITELMTGTAFAVSAYWILSLSIYSGLGLLLSLLSLLVIVSSLIVIFFADMKFGIIPFGAVIAGVAATLLWYMFFPLSETTLANHLYSAVGSFAGFLALFLITKGRGMGFGDVVYVFFMGMLLGFPKIGLGIYIAFVSGGIISLVFVLLKKKKIRGTTIPFGPFLVAGTFISLVWGATIIDLVVAYLLRG